MHRQLISNQPLKDDLDDLDQIDFFQPKEKKASPANEVHHQQKIEPSPKKLDRVYYLIIVYLFF